MIDQTKIADTLLNNMTQKQIQLVKKTWLIFQQIDPVLIGEVFYERLFAQHPSFKRMFTTSRQVQSKKIIAMLDVIIRKVDRMDELSEDLKNLAIRHVQYGVKTEYYQPVGTALLWMLKQGLGSDWNDEVGEAWQVCYDTIAGIMIRATYAAQT